MNRIKQLASITDKVMDLMALLAGVMVIFLIIIVTADTFLRYIFNSPILWAVDAVEAILLYILFLGAAWLLRDEGHVMVEIVFQRMNPNVQDLLNVVTSILGVIMCLALTWFAGKATWGNFQRGVLIMGGITYPKYLLLAPVPLGSFLLSVQFLRRAHHYLISWLLRREI
jgi:TRAP-type C4-dicarboxylate transport system permease small subunit